MRDLVVPLSFKRLAPSRPSGTSLQRSFARSASEPTPAQKQKVRQNGQHRPRAFPFIAAQPFDHLANGLCHLRQKMLSPRAPQGKGNPRDLSEDSVELKRRQGITRLYTTVWPNQTHLVLFLSAPNTPNNDSSFVASSVPVINSQVNLQEQLRSFQRTSKM